MISTISSQQSSLCNQLLEKCQNLELGGGAIVHLRGSVGSGKTTILKKLHGQASGDLKSIFVRTQSDPVEGGAAVLAELIDQLRSHRLFDNKEGVSFEDPAIPWDDKFRVVQQAVANHRDKLIIICDEPSRWFAYGNDIVDAPDREGRLLAHWIFHEATCRRVVSGLVPDGSKRFNSFETPEINDGRSLLEEAGLWSDANELARQVASTAKRSLYYRSVLDIRLLVARQWLFDCLGKRKRIEMQFSATSLLEDLLDELQQAAKSDDKLREFCHALSRMSVARIEIPELHFQSLMKGMPSLHRSIIESCFCEQSDCRFALHPLIRYSLLRRQRDKNDDARKIWRLDPTGLRTIHKDLYVGMKSQPTKSLRTNVELFHHGVLSDQLQATNDASYFHFVQQLLEVGRSLSYFHREHIQAAEVFKLALQFDEHNAYAHHYYAFNLDWVAAEKDKVEQHYQRAIELEPTHPWRWSRWVAYLTTIGQYKLAEQEWRRALNAMSIDENATPDWVYLSLHRWVTRWMLHWSRLDVAESILDSVPKHLFNDASFRRLRDLLVALREAQVGCAVFPLSVPASQWWTAQGHAGLPKQLHGRQLTKWIPARVESVTENDTVYLTIGFRPKTDGQCVDIDHLELSRTQFDRCHQKPDWASLSEGCYLELGFYGQSSEPEAFATHETGRFRDRDLIPLVPPADRWFNKAVDAAWKQGDQE